MINYKFEEVDSVTVKKKNTKTKSKRAMPKVTTEPLKNVKENIEEVNIATQSNEDMKAYAIYVARCRAIPDCIDGLKPVIRRIIWCAGNDFKGQGFVKTASMMGRVIQKYNPHGDASVKLAIRNMINSFSTKYPTMVGSGSWGTKINPCPASERYTSCKLSQFAIDVFLQDIYDDRSSTDWVPTYENNYWEPVYLPAKIPTLLILGQMGIAVGMKTSIPSHNLGEVIDVTIKLMKDPNAPFCLIPDECMPCQIQDTDFQKINDTGIGSYVSQGIIDIGEYDRHPALFVKSLPDFTFFDSIKETINEMWREKKMPYIIDMVSQTRTDLKTGKFIMSEVIILQKGSDPYFVREFLYANTGIRQIRQVRLITIHNKKLEPMTYRSYLLEFINFRRRTIFRRMNGALQKYKTAIHEKEFFVKVMTNKDIDKIITMIRKQKTKDDSVLVEYLIDKLRITTSQAKFLLKTDLAKLSAGHLEEYKQQLKEYKAKEKELFDTITSQKKIDEYIINEMLEIKKKYNTPRLCKIISKEESLGIAPGTFKLVFTKKNFIRKIGENEAITGLGNDEVNFSIIAENTDDILIFTQLGKVFKVPVSKIFLYAKGTNGMDVRILNKYITSNIACAARYSTIKKLAEFKRVKKNYIFVVTRKGYVKKMDLDDMLNAIPSGIIFSKLDEGDYVQDIIFGPDTMDILFYSGPKVLRISSKEVPYLKRSTKGNRVSTANTLIDGMNFAMPMSTELVIVTKLGFINKIPLNIVERSNRGKAGVRVIRLNKANRKHPDDTILSIWPCRDEDVIAINEGRKTEHIPVADIPQGTTVSTGKQMVQNPIRVTLQK